MLILTRKTNERIFIGDNIVLVVLGVENNRVKLGIEAPTDVTILREEIVSDVKGEHAAGSRSDAVVDDEPLKTGTDS